MQNIRVIARQTLSFIAHYIEENIPELEVEPGEEDILIIDKSSQNFLLNYHGVTHQIWYSSAISGAHHFALDKNGVWHCTRSGHNLFDVLSKELTILCQRDVNLPNA